jgi:flavin reductase (DIM6/NTAB) family NADH-FMN oxidoreductase RutF
MSQDNREVAAIMSCMPYGLYIVGSNGDDGPNAMMADWVMQMSFTPRLVGVAIENDAHTLANVKEAGAFTLNFLSEGLSSMNLARHFSAPYKASKIGGPLALGARSKLAPEAYWKTKRGCPILHAAMAWLDCAANRFVTVGDHTLVIAEVTDGRMQTEGTPLTSGFTGWTYCG